MGKVDDRLRTLKLELPAVAAPAANYVPAVESNGMLYISGQLPMLNGAVQHVGHLGDEFGVTEGQMAARLCGLNILAQAKAALGGDLDRIVRCVKLTGFVACTPAFTDHPKVINGASDLLVEVLGDAGRHARAAVGMASLPLGAAVEVEAIFQLS